MFLSRGQQCPLGVLHTTLRFLESSRIFPAHLCHSLPWRANLLMLCPQSSMHRRNFSIGQQESLSHTLRKGINAGLGSAPLSIAAAFNITVVGGFTQKCLYYNGVRVTGRFRAALHRHRRIAGEHRASSAPVCVAVLSRSILNGLYVVSAN